MRRVALAVALATVAGCGREPQGVPVGQADDGGRPPSAPWRSDALDTVYADTLAWADSLAADARAAADTLVRARAPTVDAAWAAVQDAVRARRRAAWDAATGSAPGAHAAWEALGDDPFREGLLALSPRDLQRDGTARVARVVVGYDAAGAVVPQDEADTDRTLALRFDVVDGAYRVVSVEAP